MYPTELKYSETHEWVRQEGEIAYIGITSYAIEALTDLTYLEFEVEVGDVVSKGDNIGVIESVKATSDIYTPLSGEIVGINEELGTMLEELSQDPYEVGWMIKLKLSTPEELDSLMNAEEYEKKLEEEEH